MIARSSLKLKSSGQDDWNGILALAGMENFVDWKGMPGSFSSGDSRSLNPEEAIGLQSVTSNETTPFQSVTPHSQSKNVEKKSESLIRNNGGSSKSYTGQPTYEIEPTPLIPTSICFEVPDNDLITFKDNLCTDNNVPPVAAARTTEGKKLGSKANAAVATSEKKMKPPVFTQKLKKREKESQEAAKSAEVRAKARSERKQARKKMKRMEVNTKIEELTCVLLQIEREEHEKVPNNPSNRVDLMARTIVMLNNMHNGNKKRKEMIRELKRKIKEQKEHRHAVDTIARNNKARSLAQAHASAKIGVHDPRLHEVPVNLSQENRNFIDNEPYNPYANLTPQEMQIQMQMNMEMHYQQMQMRMEMQMRQFGASSAPHYFASPQQQQHQHQEQEQYQSLTADHVTSGGPSANIQLKGEEEPSFNSDFEGPMTSPMINNFSFMPQMLPNHFHSSFDAKNRGLNTVYDNV